MYFKVEMSVRLRGTDDGLNIPLVIDTDAEGSAQPVLDDFVKQIKVVFAESRTGPYIFRMDTLKEGELNKIGYHPMAAEYQSDIAIDFNEVAVYSISALSVVD
jgi:hypothetical protein